MLVLTPSSLEKAARHRGDVGHGTNVRSCATDADVERVTQVRINDQGTKEEKKKN